jgi:hypothetical protein
MRTCRHLIATVILLIAPVTASPVSAQDGPTDESERPAGAARGGGAAVGATRGAEARRARPTLLELAYADALSILSRDNSCSRFLGGSGAAEEALGRLVAQLRGGMISDATVGIRMSGAFTFYSRPAKGFSYRLFAEARINTFGPFYKATAFRTDPFKFIPNVGSFRPNTREARVLMLLHELGHLIVGPGGRWLLPDDADNPSQNARNTALVESQCREQILSLRDGAGGRAG